MSMKKILFLPRLGGYVTRLGGYVIRRLEYQDFQSVSVPGNILLFGIACMLRADLKILILKLPD